jgi:hypothetical protein
MPDLSMLTGWDARLQLQTGVAVTVSVTAGTSTLGVTDLPSVDPPAAGTKRTSASNASTVTP